MSSSDKKGWIVKGLCYLIICNVLTIVCYRVMQEKDLIEREFKETVSQLEEDTDLEIEQLRVRRLACAAFSVSVSQSKYEMKLRNERDATLRLKG